MPAPSEYIGPADTALDAAYAVIASAFNADTSNPDAIAKQVRAVQSAIATYNALKLQGDC